MHYDQKLITHGIVRSLATREFHYYNMGTVLPTLFSNGAPIATEQEYEPGFRECVRYSAHFGICSKLALCSPFSLQRFYVRTSRQLKRIESTTRSLIYVHFSETIAGSSTIRAYNVQQRFIATSMQQIDRNLVFYFASISSSRYRRHTPACMYNTRPHCATKSQPRNFQPLSCR